MCGCGCASGCGCVRVCFVCVCVCVCLFFCVCTCVWLCTCVCVCVCVCVQSQHSFVSRTALQVERSSRTMATSSWWRCTVTARPKPTNLLVWLSSPARKYQLQGRTVQFWMRLKSTVKLNMTKWSIMCGFIQAIHTCVHI